MNQSSTSSRTQEHSRRPDWRLTIAATGEAVIFGETTISIDGTTLFIVGGAAPSGSGSGTVLLEGSSTPYSVFAASIGCQWILVEAARTVHADKAAY